jgi:hypothetical protein
MALHLLQMEQDGGKHQNKWSKIYSQRSVEEHLMETTIGDGDTHLVEFSDAMRSMKQVSLTLCSLSVLVFPSVSLHWKSNSLQLPGTVYKWFFLFAAVEKALRQVAESKARAHDEAAEWKRKYEMERLRAASLEQEQQALEQELEQCRSPPGWLNILDLETSMVCIPWVFVFGLGYRNSIWIFSVTRSVEFWWIGEAGHWEWRT